jgi:hypothetical protein
MREALVGVLRTSGFLSGSDEASLGSVSRVFVVGDLMHNSGSHNKNCLKLVLVMLPRLHALKVKKWLVSKGMWKTKNRMIDNTMIIQHLIMLAYGLISNTDKDYPSDVRLPSVAVRHLLVHMKLRGLLMTKSPAAETPAHVLRIQLMMFYFDRTLYALSEVARDKGFFNKTSKSLPTSPSFQVFNGLYVALMRNYRLVSRVTSVEWFDCNQYEALFIALRNVTHFRSDYKFENVLNAIEHHRIASAVKKEINTVESALSNQTEHKLAGLALRNECLTSHIDGLKQAFDPTPCWGPLPDEKDPDSSPDDVGEWFELPIEMVRHFSWSVIFFFTLGDLAESAWYYPDGKQSFRYESAGCA